MKNIFFAASLVLSSQVLVASDHDQSQSNSSVQRLSFEDFREACRNPSRFHNQVAPTNIQISCADVALKWVPDTSKDLTMATSRYMTSTVASDKYVVDSLTAPLNSDAQLVSCPSFKEISERVETILSVTCSEILDYSGSVTNFCEQSVNSLKLSNPSAPVIQDTGRVTNLCGNVSHKQDQDQAPDQSQQIDQGQQGQSQVAAPKKCKSGFLGRNKCRS